MGELMGWREPFRPVAKPGRSGPLSHVGDRVALRSLAEFTERYGPLPPGRSNHASGAGVDVSGEAFAGVPSMLVERYGARYSVEWPEPRGFALWGSGKRHAQIGGEWDRAITRRRRDRAAAWAKGWLFSPLGGHHVHVHIGVKGRQRIREMQVLAGLREMGRMLDAIYNEV